MWAQKISYQEQIQQQQMQHGADRRGDQPGSTKNTGMTLDFHNVTQVNGSQRHGSAKHSTMQGATDKRGGSFFHPQNEDLADQGNDNIA